jgi:DNA modification methylase
MTIQNKIDAQLQIVYKNSEELIPYINNPRTHTPTQVAQVAASIQEFGWTNPVLLDGQNGIIAGHGRVLAASILGIDSIPTIELKHLSEAQKKAYVIADNQLAQNAGWDEKLLGLEIGSLEEDGFDISLLGFNDIEIERLTFKPNEGLTDPDEVGRVPENEGIVKPGDVWILGNHRLICGDATKSDVIEQLMQSHKAEMVFTDPPYGVSYTGNVVGTEWDMMKNDDLVGKDLYNMLKGAFKQMFVSTIDNPALYVWHSSLTQTIFENALIDAGFEVKQQLIWNKGLVMSRTDYHNSHEPCFYVRKVGNNNEWYGDRKHRTILRQENVDLKKLKKDELIHMVTSMKDESTVWEIKRDHGRHYMHPTQKPTDLAIKAILNNSRPGNIVLDFFLGSGSTIIGCEQSDRICYGVELDPYYCDIIINRWQNFTGKEATIEGTNETYNNRKLLAFNKAESIV